MMGAPEDSTAKPKRISSVTHAYNEEGNVESLYLVICDITKNNWYVLYGIPLPGIVSTSKVPLRIATISGFLGAVFSLVVEFYLPSAQAHFLAAVHYGRRAHAARPC